MFSLAATCIFISAFVKVVPLDNEVLPERCEPILEVTNASQVSEDSYEVNYNKKNNEEIQLGTMEIISDETNTTFPALLKSIEIGENNGTMYFSRENLTAYESYTIIIAYEFDNGSCTLNVSSKLTLKHYVCEPILEIINASQVTEDIYEINYNKWNNKKVQLKKMEFISDETNMKFPTLASIVPSINENEGTMYFSMENLTVYEPYTLIITYEFENGSCISHASSRFTKMRFGANIYLFIAAFVIASFVITFFVYIGQKSKFEEVLKKLKSLFFPWYGDPHDTVSEFSFEFHDCSGRQEINPLYQPLEQCQVQNDDSLEFSREKIEMKEIIGVGEFGEVYYAKAHGILGLRGYVLVAVKKMKSNPTEQARCDFLKEINTLKKIGRHKNIVEMLACVTKSEPYMIIMELIRNGNLKDYLLELRKIWEDRKNTNYFDGKSDYSYVQPTQEEEEGKQQVEWCGNGSGDNIIVYEHEATTPILEEASPPPFPVLDHMELQFFASQIASGMAHLERIGITHRDLAARNILITKDKILKITDFGMSRPGPYVNLNMERRIPLRWCSIEAIKELKTNNKSDVWSFGVVLWEIGTLGAFPYGDMVCNEVIRYLKSGRRLYRPEICTDELYDIMLRCWRERPEDRPSFSELVKLLDAEKRHVYVEFRKISPNYVFPEIYSPK